MSLPVFLNDDHILFHRLGYELDLMPQFPNFREDANAGNAYGTTPLHVLCLTKLCDKVVAENLIENGAEVNAMNHFDCTPLHFAAIHRNESMIDILIEHGADVNLQDMYGNTALHFAIKNYGTVLYLPQHPTGDLGIVQKLINYGADIDKINQACETPLMFAIREDSMDIVKELLACGAVVNTRNSRLETCLHVASRNIKLNSDILIELMKHGASVNCLDLNGMTALDVLIESKDPDQGLKSAKALIKAATLVNFEHKIDFRFRKRFLALNRFIRECSEEVLSMKRIVYTEKFSLCHFALNGVYDTNLRNVSEESIFDKVLDTLSNYTFPIYHDLIEAKFERSYLCQKLQKLDIYAGNERGNVTISLNRDVIPEISRYLSDRDLFNFMRAYTKSDVPLGDI